MLEWTRTQLVKMVFDHGRARDTTSRTNDSVLKKESVADFDQLQQNENRFFDQDLFPAHLSPPFPQLSRPKAPYKRISVHPL